MIASVTQIVRFSMRARAREKMNQIRKHNNFESRKRITMSMIKHFDLLSVCLFLWFLGSYRVLLFLSLRPQKIIASWSREREREGDRDGNCLIETKASPTVSSGSDVKSSKFVNVKAWNEINQTRWYHQSSRTPTLILVDVVEWDDNESCLLIDTPSLPFVDRIDVDVARKSMGRATLLSFALLLLVLLSFKLRRRTGFFRIRLKSMSDQLNQKTTDDYRKLDLRLLEENTDVDGRVRVSSIAEKFPSKCKEIQHVLNVWSEQKRQHIPSSSNNDELYPASCSHKHQDRRVSTSVAVDWWEHRKNRWIALWRL